MGMGFLKVFGKSVGKALKNTGIAVGAGALTAAGLLMQNPEAMGALWVATGPIAPLALIALSIGGQALVDVVKHRDKI